MLFRFIICIMILGISAQVCAQEPWDFATTTINGKEVRIEYGRPVLRGRTLPVYEMACRPIASGVPARELLRSSAQKATTHRRKEDPAGDYALYMHCPETGAYALVINSETRCAAWHKFSQKRHGTGITGHSQIFMSYSLEIAEKEVARIP